jgi:hypothetical protein
MMRAETIHDLFTADNRPVLLRSSVISIQKIWLNWPDELYSFKVEAESHKSYTYPHDKLLLAIQRFLWLRNGCNDIKYDPKEHEQYAE